MKYRKKPVVIEAIKLVNACIDSEDYEWEDWAQEAFDKGEIELHGPNNIIAKIKTLEGTMDANYGDYLIQGVKGEIYPCKPDIFEATYEKVEQETTRQSDQMNIKFEKEMER